MLDRCEERTALIGLLALVVAAAAIGTADATRRDSQVARNGDWIAYSTVSHLTLYRGGSDVFVVRAGDEPVLVAGRGNGRTWNVCPAFSPDGTMLAFATRTSGRLSITVVRMTPSGPTVARRVKLQVPGSGAPPCVRWPADGTRLAYLASGKVVVRGLDGWRRRARVGDPRRRYFLQGDTVVSPTGDRVAGQCNGPPEANR